MDAPPTVTEAVALLESQGFDGGFMIGEHGFSCRSGAHLCPPGRLEVLQTFRYEGVSDPADASIVLGVRCPDCGARGIVVSAYGADAEPQLLALLDLLE